jgi:hypothetical protein
MNELGQLIGRKGFPYRRICRDGEFSRSSLARWLGRYRRGEEVFQAPGPKRTERPDIAGITERIIELAHGKKRTAGTGALYQECKDDISKRLFDEIVRQARREANDESIIGLTRIEWRCPGLVWAMDEVEWRDEVVLTIRELTSKYRLLSLVGRKVTGADIAQWLDGLFRRYGPPLVLKRDNGSRLKCREVDELLKAWCVIPLDSPRHYPKYNGSAEQAQGEFQRYMDVELPGAYNEKELDLAVRLTAHELNHMNRRSLEMKTACEIFRLGLENRKEYGLRKRAEVFGRIREIAATIMVELELTAQRASVYQRAQTAWRKAVQYWLQENDLITVTQEGNVLPLSPLKKSQN